MRFEDILTQHSVPFVSSGHHHSRPGWINIDCPFCSPNWKHYRMGYNLSRKYVHCWSCGSHGLIDTLVELTGRSFRQCREMFQDIVLEQSAAPARKHRGKVKIPKGITGLQKQHKKYLEGRGYNPEHLVDLWDVKGIGVASTLSWRIFIPVYYGGEIVSWTTRAISDKAVPRYVSASVDDEVYSHKELLYGEEWCRQTIIVCEGPMDVWKIGPGAVAVMGTSYTRSQVHKIANYTKRYICFDTDRPGELRASELADALSPFPGDTSIIQLSSGKDPGEAKAKEISQLRKLLD